MSLRMEPNIGYLMSDSSRLLRRIFDERMSGLGLTSVQARLLLSLTKFPDNNQAFYADRLEVEPITLTRLVDRMEESGWVERVADPNDRRARLLHLTDKSAAILGLVRASIDTMVEEMLDGISASDREVFTRTLTVISANLSAERSPLEVAHG